jgi:hypothetical protein
MITDYEQTSLISSSCVLWTIFWARNVCLFVKVHTVTRPGKRPVSSSSEISKKICNMKFHSTIAESDIELTRSWNVNCHTSFHKQLLCSVEGIFAICKN